MADSSIALGAAGTGGRGGNVVHAAIEALGDSSQGLELAVHGDSSWALTTIERDLGTRARIALDGETADSFVTILAPPDFTNMGAANYEDANAFRVDIEQGSDPAPATPAIMGTPAVPGVSARVVMHFGVTETLTVFRLPDGAEGNDWKLQYGTASLGAGQPGVVVATADIAGVFYLQIEVNPDGLVASIQDLNVAIAALPGFTTISSAGLDQTVILPTDHTMVLTGTTAASTTDSTVEDFTGGVDGDPAVNAEADTPAVAASVDIVLPDGAIRFFREIPGVAGTWTLRIVDLDNDALLGADGVNTSRVFSTTGGVTSGQVSVNLSINNRPTVAAVRLDLNGVVEFDAEITGGADPNQIFPTDLSTVFPGGQPSGNGFFETLTPGIDAIPGRFDVPAVPADPGLGFQFSNAIDEPERWIIRVPPAVTLDEIATAIMNQGVSALNGNAIGFGADGAVVTGDGTSTLQASRYLSGDVGDVTSYELRNAMNEVLGAASKDDDNKLVTLSYGPADTAITVFETLEGIILGTSFIGITPNDAVLEAPGFTRYFRGVGDGGGGGVLFRTLAEATKVTFQEAFVASIDFTAINVAVDTGIAVPANTKTFHVNYGSSHVDDDDSGIDLIWFPVPIEEWERLDGVEVGDAPTQGNVRFTRSWRDTDVGTAGGVTARQVWLSRGNSGNIFVMTDNVGYDIFPFRARFEIHEAVSVLSDVTSGAAPTTPVAPVAPVTPVTTGGLSEIIILAPGSDPDREDWEEGAAQWTGEELVPIVRELAGGHGAVVRFATISATDGMEIIETTATISVMRDSFPLNKTVAWLWAIDDDVEVGDLAYRINAGVNSYYRCIRDHTTVDGDATEGAPDVALQTGWEDYEPASVVAAGSYRGVFRDTQDVPAPLASGQWVVTTAAGYAYPERYTTSPDRWLRYIIPSVALFGQIFNFNAEAYSHIRSFNSSEPQYLVIAGFLKVLTFYSAPATGHESFHARAVQKQNPRAYFWLNGQTMQDYQGAGNANFPFTGTPIGTNQAMVVGLASANPNNAYDNGDVVYAGTVGTIGALTLSGFTLPRGRHDVHVVLESNAVISTFTSAFWKRDVGGADDRYISGLYRGEATNAVLGVTAGIRYIVTDVVADGTEEFYLALMSVGDTAVRLRGHVMLEYKGAD